MVDEAVIGYRLPYRHQQGMMAARRGGFIRDVTMMICHTEMFPFQSTLEYMLHAYSETSYPPATLATVIRHSQLSDRVLFVHRTARCSSCSTFNNYGDLVIESLKPPFTVYPYKLQAHATVDYHACVARRLPWGRRQMKSA